MNDETKQPNIYLLVESSWLAVDHWSDATLVLPSIISFPRDIFGRNCRRRNMARHRTLIVTYINHFYYCSIYCEERILGNNLTVMSKTNRIRKRFENISLRSLLLRLYLSLYFRNWNAKIETFHCPLTSRWHFILWKLYQIVDNVRDTNVYLIPNDTFVYLISNRLKKKFASPHKC